MKILLINSVCGTGSTGRLCADLADALTKKGHTVCVAYGRGNAPAGRAWSSYKIESEFGVRLHGIYARIFDASGFGSRWATRKFIRWICNFDPDVIHLHNLHGYYLNIEILFDYLRASGKRIIWTLHDCWPFTGHCCYFDYIACEKWKEQCDRCLQLRDYPASLFRDASRSNYKRKKRIFGEVENLSIVTPSKWLAGLVQQSFLSTYPIRILPNWIDTSEFRYIPSNIRDRLQITSKYMILGVASVWDRRKGLNIFLLLNKLLNIDLQIVLVGVTRSQKHSLPSNVIGIERTSNKRELAELYSAADIFVNPTFEDNYPSTNLEAIACGTPVVSFASGGSGESADLYGISTPTGNVDLMAAAIKGLTNGTIKLKLPDVKEMNRVALLNYIRLEESGEKEI